MKLKTLALGAFFTVALAAFSQAKKPTLMVMPSDNWCQAKGYMKTFDNQGITENIPDYDKALLEDSNLDNVISKINILMADRGFPLKSLSQTNKSIRNLSAEDQLIQSKTTGASLKESPLDRLRRTAKADIILYVNWQVSTVGPKNTVTYNLVGMDAYTNKQVAGAQGTGAPSFSAEVPVLLEEAVQNNMDNFCAQLQAHFDDLLENGREIAIDVKVFDDGSGVDLESEDNEGTELSELIENWIAENTVNHRYNLSDATENYMTFEQVRIPIYKKNGMPEDAMGFGRELRKYVQSLPFNIPCKLLNKGLGRCLLIIGEK